MNKFMSCLAVLVVSGCIGVQYAEPDLSGLDVGAPFPNQDDVCVELIANQKTRDITDVSRGLIGCPEHEVGAISDRIDDGFVVVGKTGPWAVLAPDNGGSQSPITNDLGKSHGLTVNQTVLSFDDFHGTQVAYLSDDGREWLWYPGNQSALLGYWKTQTLGGKKQICFRYPNSSVNPATGVAGPKWECTPMARYAKRTIERTPGDVFNLSSGRLPKVLEKRRYYTLKELLGRG